MEDNVLIQLFLWSHLVKPFPYLYWSSTNGW